MGRKRLGKVQVTITVDPEIMDWIEDRVKRKVYATKSHAFEAGILKLQQLEGMIKGYAVGMGGEVIIRGEE